MISEFSSSFFSIVILLFSILIFHSAVVFPHGGFPTWFSLTFFEVFRSRSSYRRCSVRKGVLRNFPKFMGKHLRQSPLFNKVAGLRPATLLK